MTTKEEVDEALAGLERSLDIALEKSAENARIAEERRVAILATMEQLAEIAETLRRTAKGIRDFSRNQNTEDALNPFHAANRLDRIAREIAGTK